MMLIIMQDEKKVKINAEFEGMNFLFWQQSVRGIGLKLRATSVQLEGEEVKQVNQQFRIALNDFNTFPEQCDVLEQALISFPGDEIEIDAIMSYGRLRRISLENKTAKNNCSLSCLGL